MSRPIALLILPFLLIALIIGLWLKLKSDGIATKEAKRSLSLVEKEYENYKKRALDNQMKLKRELQTERNKLLELKK